VTTVVRILEGEGPAMLKQREEAIQQLEEEIREGEFTAFPLVVTGKDIDQTMSAIVQAAGIGPLRSNTVIVNWIAGTTSIVAPPGLQRFSRNLRTAFGLGCNLLILDADTKEWETLDKLKPSERVIDIWWHASKTGELMLLLGHLVTRNEDWQGAKIRVLAKPAKGETTEETTERLESALEKYRIEAEVVVCEMTAEEMERQSHNSSLVFLPFSFRGGRFCGPVGEVMEVMKRLPIVVLTLAAQDVDLAADPDKESEETAGEEKKVAGELDSDASQNLQTRSTEE